MTVFYVTILCCLFAEVDLFVNSSDAIVGRMDGNRMNIDRGDTCDNLCYLLPELCFKMLPSRNLTSAEKSRTCSFKHDYNKMLYMADYRHDINLTTMSGMNIFKGVVQEAIKTNTKTK